MAADLPVVLPKHHKKETHQNKKVVFESTTDLCRTTHFTSALARFMFQRLYSGVLCLDAAVGQLVLADEGFSSAN